MKSKNWTTVFLIILSATLAAVAPFLPGPANTLAHDISTLVQGAGYLGLFFVPFGLVWLIIESRNKKDQKLNRWTNGYYPAWLTVSPFLVLVLIQLLSAFREGLNMQHLPFAAIFLILFFILFQIQKLKNKTAYKFNAVPVYLVLLPLSVVLITHFTVEKAAAHSREKVIRETEPLLSALENYNSAQGHYPDKLEDLVGTWIYAIPTFKVMGVNAYQYEKRGQTFQLSFEQNWHWNATDVVVYVKNGHQIMTNTYENFATGHPHWRYFMVD